MDNTQPTPEDLMPPAVDPSRDAVSLLGDLETLDPADAPAVAERLAEVLTDRLDATGHGATTQQMLNAASGSEEQAR